MVNALICQNECPESREIGPIPRCLRRSPIGSAVQIRFIRVHSWFHIREGTAIRSLCVPGGCLEEAEHSRSQPFRAQSERDIRAFCKPRLRNTVATAHSSPSTKNRPVLAGPGGFVIGVRLDAQGPTGDIRHTLWHQADVVTSCRPCRRRGRGRGHRRQLPSSRAAR